MAHVCIEYSSGTVSPASLGRGCSYVTFVLRRSFFRFYGLEAFLVSSETRVLLAEEKTFFNDHINGLSSYTAKLCWTTVFFGLHLLPVQTSLNDSRP